MKQRNYVAKNMKKRSVVFRDRKKEEKKGFTKYKKKIDINAYR